jgi:hypothetical protein
MYHVWKNPYTSQYWVVDCKGKGAPGRAAGPYKEETVAISAAENINEQCKKDKKSEENQGNGDTRKN